MLETTVDKKLKKRLQKIFNCLNVSSRNGVQERFFQRYLVVKEIFSRQIIPDHLVELDQASALLKLLSPQDIDALLDLGMHEACLGEDMSILSNALFSRNRLVYHRNLTLGAGADHSRHFRTIIECFACNDIQLVETVFRENNELAKNGNTFNVLGINLLMSIICKREDWLRESLLKAEKYESGSNSQFDRAVIGLLVCIANKNGSQCEVLFLEIINLYGRTKWLHEFQTPSLKLFSPFIHGLHNFAHYVLGIQIPVREEQIINTAFWTQFSDFHKENHFKCAIPFITFDGELSLLNRIYD